MSYAALRKFIGLFIIMLFISSITFSLGTVPTLNEELLTAVQKNDVVKVKIILAKEGSDVNFKDKEGFTPLMFAAINNYKAMTEYLLTQKEIDIDAINIYGYKAITLAAIFGNTSIIKVLKKAGAKE